MIEMQWKINTQNDIKFFFLEIVVEFTSILWCDNKIWISSIFPFSTAICKAVFSFKYLIYNFIKKCFIIK